MATWVNLLDVIYPVGSIYISNSSTSPSSVVGGTWVQVSGYYLYTANTNGTGGASTVTHSHARGTYTAAIAIDHLGSGYTQYSPGTSPNWNPSFASPSSHIDSSAPTINEGTLILGESASTTINIAPKYKAVFCWYRTA